MLSFYGVTFVLFVLHFRPFCFHQSRGPSFDRSSICMHPGNHTQLPNNCLYLLVFCLFFVSWKVSLFPSIMYHCRFLHCRCVSALSTLPKRTTPLTEPSSGQYLPALACHEILSRSFVNSTMMACEHVCGSTTGCARSGLLWNRAFVKGACSRPSCSTSSSRYKRSLRAFQGRQRHYGRFGAFEEENGGRGGGEATAREPALVMPLWGVFYADDAGVVSQSPEQLRKMMGVIMSCARHLASPYWRPRLRSCVYTRRSARVHRHIQHRGSGPGIQSNERVCIPRWDCQPQYHPVHRGRPANMQCMVQLLEVHP